MLSNKLPARIGWAKNEKNDIYHLIVECLTIPDRLRAMCRRNVKYGEVIATKPADAASCGLCVRTYREIERHLNNTES